MYTANLGAATVAYTGSVDCLAQYKKGAFGPMSSTAAKTAYSACLKSGSRDLVAQATSLPARTTVAAQRTISDGVGAYVPNCAGTYNPCTEIQKGEAAGKTITASLKAKCAAYQAQCGAGGEETRYQTEGGVEIDPATGLPVEPWYMNKTYWLIGGAVVVGALLLSK